MYKFSRTIPCRTTEPLPRLTLIYHVWDSSFETTYGTKQCQSLRQEQKGHGREDFGALFKVNQDNSGGVRRRRLQHCLKRHISRHKTRSFRKTCQPLLGHTVQETQGHEMFQHRDLCSLLSKLGRTLKDLFKFNLQAKNQSLLKQHINKLASHLVALSRISTFNPFQAWIGN